MSNEDPLAAADVLAPEEVRSLSRTVDTAARRAQELQLARTAAAPLAGLDLSVDNLDLTTETLADGYVKVTVTSGDLSASTEKDKFSPIMQRVLRDSDDDDSSQVDLAGLAKGAELPTFVMAVERGGRWYVSAAYTALEYIREANDLPPADFGSGVAATATLGADSPDAAVQEAMAGTLRRVIGQELISLAPPGEIPVYDYRDALDPARPRHDDRLHDRVAAGTCRRTGWTATPPRCSCRPAGTTESGRVVARRCVLQAAVRRRVRGHHHRRLVRSCSLLAVPFFGAQSDERGGGDDHRGAQGRPLVRQPGRHRARPGGPVPPRHHPAAALHTARRAAGAAGGRPAHARPAGDIADPSEGAYVYTLDARKGDRLLGLVTEEPASEDDYGAGQVLVYGPDGEILENSYRLIDGRGLVIPADGTYKFVVRPYYRAGHLHGVGRGAGSRRGQEPARRGTTTDAGPPATVG